MIPKDVAGRELKVGQQVAHTVPGYRDLMVSVVVAVTEKTVELQRNVRRLHSHVCIVEVTQ